MRGNVQGSREGIFVASPSRVSIYRVLRKDTHWAWQQAGKVIIVISPQSISYDSLRRSEKSRLCFTKFLPHVLDEITLRCSRYQRKELRKEQIWQAVLKMGELDKLGDLAVRTSTRLETFAEQGSTQSSPSVLFSFSDSAVQCDLKVTIVH